MQNQVPIKKKWKFFFFPTIGNRNRKDSYAQAEQFHTITLQLQMETLARSNTRHMFICREGGTLRMRISLSSRRDARTTSSVVMEASWSSSKLVSSTIAVAIGNRLFQRGRGKAWRSVYTCLLLFLCSTYSPRKCVSLPHHLLPLLFLPFSFPLEPGLTACVRLELQAQFISMALAFLVHYYYFFFKVWVQISLFNFRKIIFLSRWIKHT